MAVSAEMTVDSWTDHVQTIEQTSEQILSWTSAPAPRDVWAQVATYDAHIRGLGTLFADAAPLPVPEETAAHDVSSAVERVVVALFDGDSPPSDAVDRARAAGRITETGDVGVTVPLGRFDAPVANWYVLLPVLAERLDTSADHVERAAGRMEMQDRGPSASALRDVAGALRDTATTVRNVTARTLWLNPPDGLVDAEYTQIREYATRTINSYSQLA